MIFIIKKLKITIGLYFIQNRCKLLKFKHLIFVFNYFFSKFTIVKLLV
jgi:hypothetical protein